MTDQIKVEIKGKAAFDAHISRVIAALDVAAQRGVNKAVAVYAQTIGRELRRRTHPLGTATNSPPGDPPSLMTGHLLRSVKVRQARRVTAHVFEGSTGPTAVQSRIQELGGWTGRGHRTYLPPRPYVGPAVGAGSSRARAIIAYQIREALKVR